MYGGSGQPWRMPLNPAAQQSNFPRPFVMPDSSAPNHSGGNSVNSITSPDMQNSGWQQQADLLEAQSQKLQNDLEEVGQKIKHHEDNIRFLKASKRKLDESIFNKQVSLGGTKTMEGNPAHLSTEETIENILKHENSAAALYFKLKKQAESMSSVHSLTRDVIGIVATLGKVDNENLSRLLSKYLGLETMLAVVCKTHEDVRTLEAYNMEGLIDKELGLHAFAASVETPLADQFDVISLEDIRAYDGALVDDDPQRRLALLKPRLPNGETPPGFLGFAVNMINIDKADLHHVSKTGHKLRETLFYHLFSNLQVYRSRLDMLRARSCISNGAISLDGGTIKRPGSFTLGRNQQDIDVKFPVSREGLNPSLSHLELVNELREIKWKRDRTLGDMQIEEKLLHHAKFHYEIKKRAFLQFMGERSSQMTQAQAQFYPQYQAGHGPSS